MDAKEVSFGEMGGESTTTTGQRRPVGYVGRVDPTVGVRKKDGRVEFCDIRLPDGRMIPDLLGPGACGTPKYGNDNDNDAPPPSSQQQQQRPQPSFSVSLSQSIRFRYPTSYPPVTVVNPLDINDGDAEEEKKRQKEVMDKILGGVETDLANHTKGGDTRRTMTTMKTTTNEDNTERLHQGKESNKNVS